MGVGGGDRGAVMSAAGLASFNSRKRDPWMPLFCLESEMFFWGGWRVVQKRPAHDFRKWKNTQTNREAACLFTRLPLLLCIYPCLISSPMPNHTHSSSTYPGKTSVERSFVTQFHCLSSPFLSVGIRLFKCITGAGGGTTGSPPPKATNSLNYDP